MSQTTPKDTKSSPPRRGGDPDLIHGLLHAWECVGVEFTWSLAQPVDDLANDARFRVLVAEGVVNRGCDELDEVPRNVMAIVASSGEAAELLAHCRNRASAVFAQTGAPTGIS